MTISEGNDLYKISKFDWAKMFKIENQILGKLFIIA